MLSLYIGLMCVFIGLNIIKFSKIQASNQLLNKKYFVLTWKLNVTNLLIKLTRLLVFKIFFFSILKSPVLFEDFQISLPNFAEVKMNVLIINNWTYLLHYLFTII